MITSAQSSTNLQTTDLHCHESIEQQQESLSTEIVQDVTEVIGTSRDSRSAERIEIVYEFDPALYLTRRC